MKSSPLARRTPLRNRSELKRTPLRRSSSLERSVLHWGAPIARRSRINPINRVRRAWKFQRNFGPHAEWIRSLPCVLTGRGCSGPVEAAHAVARGMGGCKGSRKDLVPLCCGHHEQQERGFETFERAYSIDLSALAAGYWARSPYREDIP